MHRLYHGYAIPTVERKVRVFTEWGINMLFGRDTTALRHLREPRSAFLQAAGKRESAGKAQL